MNTYFLLLSYTLALRFIGIIGMKYAFAFKNTGSRWLLQLYCVGTYIPIVGIYIIDYFRSIFNGP